MPTSEIAPIDLYDGVEWVIVATDEGQNFGIFVFSAEVLAKKNVFSVHAKGGKRAMRVYAPWTHPVAIQAKRTQKWQMQNFINIDNSDTSVVDFQH